MPIVLKPTILEILDDNEYELPVGYVDKDGTLHKTVKLREMTGLVDEAIADQKVRGNPGKMVTEAIFGVLESVGTIKNITKDIVRNLNNADRDFIMLMNHKYSLGDEVEWEGNCEKCGDKFEASIHINNLETKYMTQDEPKLFEVVLPKGIADAEGKLHKKLTVSMPNGIVQEKVVPILQQNPNQAVTQMLSLITEDIEGMEYWNIETFQKMSKKDRKHIADTLRKIEVGVDLAPMVSCATCGHAQKSTIPVMTLLGE